MYVQPRSREEDEEGPLCRQTDTHTHRLTDTQTISILKQTDTRTDNLLHF